MFQNVYIVTYLIFVILRTTCYWTAVEKFIACHIVYMTLIVYLLTLLETVKSDGFIIINAFTTNNVSSVCSCYYNRTEQNKRVHSTYFSTLTYTTYNTRDKGRKQNKTKYLH